jgi:hypothetical protein
MSRGDDAREKYLDFDQLFLCNFKFGEYQVLFGAFLGKNFVRENGDDIRNIWL